MINALFAAPDRLRRTWQPALERAFAAADLSVDLRPDHAAGDVDYIVAVPSGAPDDLSPFTSAKAVLSLWAGVEGLLPNPTLALPLARMVDAGLTEGMVEWATGHVLRHHLGMDAHIHGQDGVWRRQVPPLARERRVTVLGLGALGRAVAEALAGLKFDVTGWSRRRAEVAGVACLAGDAELDRALGEAEIVVLLLPLTPQTENLLDSRALARLPEGAVILNPGRGGLIDDEALLAALAGGRVAHATLDVFRREPLPPEHPFWSHPRVTVTPHIASETRPESAARVIAENVRRGEAGEPFLHLAEPSRGY